MLAQPQPSNKPIAKIRASSILSTVLFENSINIIMPIAIIALCAILAYDLMSQINQKSAMDEWDFFHIQKWFFKMIIAIVFLANVYTITNFIFSIGGIAVRLAQAQITEEFYLANPIDNVIAAVQASTNDDLGALAGLFLMTWVVRLVMLIVQLLIHFLIISRFLIIFLKISIAPIPMSTLVNRDWSFMGQNYIKTIIAVAFQGFLMMAAIALYGIMTMSALYDVTMDTIWEALGLAILYSILVVIVLLKTDSLSKSLFGAN